MLQQSVAFAFAVGLALASGCRDCSGDARKTEATSGSATHLPAAPPSRLALGGGLKVKGQQRPPVHLPLRRARVHRDAHGGRLALVVHAREQRDWLQGGKLGIRVHSFAGERWRVDPGRSTCGARYLEGGRLNSAPLSVVDAEIERLLAVGQGQLLRLAVTCAKIQSKTLAGEPHAPGLPKRMTFTGQLWLELP